MRVKSSPASRQRRKRVLKRARGFYGGRSKLIRTAYDAVDRANAMSYIGRKQRKRQFRRLWNIRINAACRAQGMTYSRFMHGLKLAGITLNRKVLADLAVTDPNGFSAILDKAKTAIG
jgi:large subunit ribosomal protein L20